MPRKRSTTVSGYYRKGHHTSGHKRTLNDDMMLELAEGNLSQRSVVSRTSAPVYVLVPDPEGISEPIYVKDEAFKVFSPSMLNYVLKELTPYNGKKKIQAVIKNISPAYQLKEGDTGSSDTDWVAVVNTVVEVWDEIEGWFGGGSSSSSQPQNPGTLVNANGLIACFLAVGTQLVGFGVHPANKQLIAFSTPNNMKAIFPNLPSGIFTGALPVPLLPVFPPTPNGAPVSMVQFALSHPDKLIRMKSAGVYEVVAGGNVIGYDPNNNPVTDPPLPNDETPPAESSGIGSALPLVAIGLILAS
jgi:hypothetical protein